MPTKPPSTRKEWKLSAPRKVLILPEEIAEVSDYAQKIYASSTFRQSDYLPTSNMYLMAKYIQFLEYEGSFWKGRCQQLLYLGAIIVWTLAIILGVLYYIFIT